MWVPEYFGTLAYVSNHPEARRCDSPWDDPRNKPEAFADRKPCIIANINMDMVGEDTVKTNSRFYFTKAPDSVPSFLDGLAVRCDGANARSRSVCANRHAQLLDPEAIPYAQGSDHDVFLGLGIPATMFGHDPDWTHHTSEDKIDKTDASEFRRVGVFASCGRLLFASTSAVNSVSNWSWRHASRVDRTCPTGYHATAQISVLIKQPIAGQNEP